MRSTAARFAAIDDEALQQALVTERSMNRAELEDGPLLGRDFVEMQIAVVRAEAGDITVKSVKAAVKCLSPSFSPALPR